MRVKKCSEIIMLMLFIYVIFYIIILSNHFIWKYENVQMEESIII